MSSLLTLLLATQAFATPAISLNHQGRLLDSAGAPIQGDTHQLTVSVFDAESGGVERWTDTFSPSFVDGYYSIELGANQAIDPAIFDGTPLFLSVQIDSAAPLSPRLKLGHAAYAVHSETTALADVATSADVALAVDWANVQNAPVSALEALGCSAPGEFPILEGGQWGCMSFAHTHDAADISSGTIHYARLKFGLGGTDVAPGNHSHTAADVGASPTGHSHTAADVGASPTGHSHTAADVGASPTGHSHTAADVGASPIGHSHTAADVGAVALLTADAACTRAGSFHFSASGQPELCDGQQWLTLSLRPAASCLDILQGNPSATSGVYDISPSNGQRLQVYCDMTTDGGGWSLLMRLPGTDALHVQQNARAGAYPCLPSDGNSCKLSSAEISRFITQLGRQVFEIRPDNASFVSWFVSAGSNSEAWPNVLECAQRSTIVSTPEWSWILTSYATAADAASAQNGVTGTYMGTGHYYPTPYPSGQVFFNVTNGLRANTAFNSGTCCNDSQPGTLWVR